MVCGEPVGRGDHFRRARRRVALEWNRRQRGVLARSEFALAACGVELDVAASSVLLLRTSAPTPTTATTIAPAIHGLNPLAALDGLAALTTPVLHVAPTPLKLQAGLWHDWPGIDLVKDSSINVQFERAEVVGPTVGHAVHP